MSQEKLNQTDDSIIAKGKRGIIQIIFSRTMVIIVLLAVQFLLLFAWMLRLNRYAPYLLGGSYVVAAFMLIYILQTKDNPMIKLSWSIMVAVLPVFGSLLYFYVQKDIGHRVEQALIQTSIRESHKLLHKQEPPDAADKRFLNMATYLQNYAGTNVCSNTSIKYFSLGELMFDEMLQQLETAEKFIFLEYFIIGNGYMWSRILEVLERKAKQGVDVRVMYDGTCAVTLLPYSYPKKLQALGIQCKMFSPLRPFVSTHYNNRDHRKILVVDGHTAFTGGVNLADEYINLTHPHGHWKDTGIMLKGEAARNLTLMFLQMWNATEKKRDYEPFLSVQGSVDTSAPGYVIPYGDNPMDRENVGKMVYLNMVNQAKNYVYIMTPYLILDNELITALELAAKRGVDVRLILPGTPDHWYVSVLAKTHYKELHEAGIKIYEYTPGFLHAKVFMCDDNEAVVGTINLDYRSLYLHFECAAYLYKTESLCDIKADFTETMKVSHLVTQENINGQSWLLRVGGALLKVAAPLM
mgnify:CR=1 FL=1